MTKLLGSSGRVVVLLVGLAALSGCGSDKHSSHDPPIPSDAVAVVGSTPISKATLNHWMSTMAGGDFYEITKITAPKRLATDPPNYGVCVQGLHALAVKLTTAELEHKCRLFYLALKQQALSYLIASQRLLDEDAELGLTVDEEEVEQEFKRLRASQFPQEAQLQAYLAERDWTLADELFLIKHDLLSSKLRSKLEPELKTDQAALVKHVRETTKSWEARTRCRPAYVVPGCQQYTASTTGAEPSAAILIEEVSRARSQ